MNPRPAVTMRLHLPVYKAHRCVPLKPLTLQINRCALFLNQLFASANCRVWLTNRRKVHASGRVGNWCTSEINSRCSTSPWLNSACPPLDTDGTNTDSGTRIATPAAAIEAPYFNSREESASCEIFRAARSASVVCRCSLYFDKIWVAVRFKSDVGTWGVDPKE